MGKPIRIIPITIAGFFLSCTVALNAQNILTEIDHDAHRQYDRLFVLSGGGDSSLHSAIKPYWRYDLVLLADSAVQYLADSRSRHDIQSIWDQNNEFVFSTSPDSVMAGLERYRTSRHPLWKTFYRTPAHFYQVDVKDFYLRVNPILRLSAGYDSGESSTLFYNQRGLSIRGGVGRSVYFQTSFYDSQVRFPNYINTYTDSVGVVPGAALYKNFESSLFDVSQARDFLLANAYVGIDIGQYFGIQLGHNQCFIGEGIRSVLMSDFSTPYFSLRFNTRVWKLHYQNIFAEISSDNFTAAPGTSMPVPKKYFAAHYLSFKPNRTFSIGLFETVVFDRENNQFELQYLNPIILYRTVEGWIGSPDNVLLGFNSRWDVKRRLTLYGQFILDDISISHILDGQLDWWGNKFGGQLGVKYFNAFGLKSLDLQAEWNSMRPYTYSHYDDHANYSNYRQVMAHPLGANFNELIFSVDYRPLPRLTLQSRIYFIKTGEDMDSVSYGSNVLIPNTYRPGDFGHHIGQGIETDIVYWRTGIQYEFASGIFADGEVVFRNKKSAFPQRNQETQFFQLGIRYMLARREDVF